MIVAKPSSEPGSRARAKTPPWPEPEHAPQQHANLTLLIYMFITPLIPKRPVDKCRAVLCLLPGCLIRDAAPGVKARFELSYTMQLQDHDAVALSPLRAELSQFALSGRYSRL